MLHTCMHARGSFALASWDYEKDGSRSLTSSVLPRTKEVAFLVHQQLGVQCHKSPEIVSVLQRRQTVSSVFSVSFRSCPVTGAHHEVFGLSFMLVGQWPTIVHFQSASSLPLFVSVGQRPTTFVSVGQRSTIVCVSWPAAHRRMIELSWVEVESPPMSDSTGCSDLTIHGGSYLCLRGTVLV